MSDVVLRPFKKDEIAVTERSRRRYESYARFGKVATFACILVFVLSLVLIPALSSASNPISFARQLMLIGVLYNGLFIVFMIAVGGWLWGKYMAQNRAFIDERSVDAKWLPLIEHERYQELKAAQGGVFQFQFEQMKGRSKW